MMMKQNHEQGNAIIIILIAVSLFAALGYAFTQSSRTSTGFISQEEAKANANQILSYGNDLKSAIKRLNLRGCDDSEISFENNIVSGYTNGTAPTNKSCHVFDPAGGGLTYKKMDLSGLDETAASATTYTTIGNMITEWYFPYNTCVNLVGSDDDPCYSASADVAEIVTFFPWVNRDVCLAINNQLGVDNPSGNPPAIGGSMMYSGGNKFTGIFTATPPRVHISFDEVPEACIYHNSAGATPGLGYFYYKTLVAR